LLVRWLPVTVGCYALFGYTLFGCGCTRLHVTLAFCLHGCLVNVAVVTRYTLPFVYRYTWVCWLFEHYVVTFTLTVWTFGLGLDYPHVTVRVWLPVGDVLVPHYVVGSRYLRWC